MKEVSGNMTLSHVSEGYKQILESRKVDLMVNTMITSQGCGSEESNRREKKLRI